MLTGLSGNVMDGTIAPTSAILFYTGSGTWATSSTSAFVDALNGGRGTITDGTASYWTTTGDSAWLKLSQNTTAPATQTSVTAAATSSGVTPVSTLDVDLTRYYSNGTSEAVHQLSGNITVTINLTATQIALINNPSNAQLLYYNPATGTLTNMNAIFDLTAGTATFQTNHFSTFVIATDSTSTLGSTGNTIGVTYDDHVLSIAWQKYVNDGSLAGTTGRSLRLEAVNIKLTGDVPTGAKITYEAHVQSKGWQKAVSNGDIAGTTGKALRLEALKITLSGMTEYEVKYRVYVQGKGWMSWQITKNATAINDAATAGTTGKALRAEAVEIIVEKTTA
jgi:hypothetical protein